MTGGEVVLLARGERVALTNRGDRPCSLLAVFAPGAFIGGFDWWPAPGRGETT